MNMAHEDGYAVHAWFSGSAPDDASTYGEVVDTCVDALMPARPSVLEEVFADLGTERPGRTLGADLPAPRDDDTTTPAGEPERPRVVQTDGISAAPAAR